MKYVQKKSKQFRDSSLAITGSRFITAPVTDEAVLKNVNQVVQTVDTEIRMLVILQPTILLIQ